MHPFIIFYYLSSFLNGVLALIFGLLVFLNNSKRKANQLFSLMCFFIAFWAFSLAICHCQLAETQENNLFWERMLNFGALFIPIFYSHYIFNLLGIDKKRKNKIILIFGYFLTLFLAFFAFPFSPFTYLYVRNIEPKLFFPYWPKAGILYYFYLLFGWGGLVGYSMLKLWKRYEESAGYKKEQMKYTLLASLLGFGGGGTNYFLWFNIPIPPFANFLVGFYPILLSYAIIKYRFMDIRWVLGRVGIYSLSFLTIILYIFGISFLNQRLGNLFSPMGFNILAGITSVLLFLYLFRFFEKTAGKYFYYTFYTLQTTLSNLTKKLNQIIELDKLTNLINRSLLDALKLDKIAIVLKAPEKKGELKPQQIIEFKEEDILSLLTQNQNFLPKYLEKTQKPLVREEIPFLIEELKRKESQTKSIREKQTIKEERSNLFTLKEALDKLKIGLFLPLLVKEELIGIIILGNKLSQEAYTVQDMNLLTTLTVQASIAFNNALSYAEIEKRKADLEHFYKLTVGRELRMIELKKKIKELEEKLKK